MLKLYKNKKWLYQKYINEKLSAFKIAKIINGYPDIVYYYLRKFKIKRRTLSETNRLGLHPGWKGGRIAKEGYILVRTPLHPNGNNHGYIREHRLIAEKALGRHLKADEHVHHINGVKDDNRNCNLLICTKSYHSWLETKMANLYKRNHFGGLKCQQGRIL